MNNKRLSATKPSVRNCGDSGRIRTLKVVKIWSSDFFRCRDLKFGMMEPYKSKSYFLRIYFIMQISLNYILCIFRFVTFSRRKKVGINRVLGTNRVKCDKSGRWRISCGIYFLVKVKIGENISWFSKLKKNCKK